MTLTLKPLGVCADCCSGPSRAYCRDPEHEASRPQTRHNLAAVQAAVLFLARHSTLVHTVASTHITHDMHAYDMRHARRLSVLVHAALSCTLKESQAEARVPPILLRPLPIRDVDRDGRAALAAA